MSCDSHCSRRNPREVLVNKSQLVDQIVTDTNMGKTEVEKVLRSFIATVQQSVKKGDKVSIPGFGGWS